MSPVLDRTRTQMNGSFAFRALMALTVASLVTGIGLFYLHAFSYVIVLAVASIFALGALCAACLERVGTSRAS
jgi:hypothetical protein